MPLVCCIKYIMFWLFKLSVRKATLDPNQNYPENLNLKKEIYYIGKNIKLK